MKKKSLLPTLVLFSVMSLLFSFNSYSQTENKPTAKYEYYIYISDVSTKEICSKLIDKIRGINKVVYFETEDFPSKYFILKSSNSFSENEFKSAIIGIPVKVLFFGEGKKSLEQMIVFKRKNNLK